MIRDIPQRQMKKIASLPPEKQRKWLANCGPEALLAIDAMFETWAHSGQATPSGEGWRVWMMMAGRGFGKTRCGAEWVHRLALSANKRRIALVGATLDEARAIMVEGPSGIINIARRRQIRINWEISHRRLTWPNGSIAELFSGDSPEGLRGPEHHFAWCDRLARSPRGGDDRGGAEREPASEPGGWHPVPGRRRGGWRMGWAWRPTRGACGERVALPFAVGRAVPDRAANRSRLAPQCKWLGQPIEWQRAGDSGDEGDRPARGGDFDT